MKSIAVFCGSSEGSSSIYKENAVKLGQELAKRGITLIYGGANVGLMGAVADAVLEQGGQVVGVLPHFLQNREIAHKGLTELIMVNSMHERKAKMADMADGFIALPGGPGTLEEYFEIFTWAQLGLHNKPCGLLNINQYFDPLVSMFDNMEREQFMQPKYRSIVIAEYTPEAILEKFSTYSAPSVKTYLTEKRT
ncbi:TIGR00730 family Rossman fold protein [Paenibacillus sp. CGMCC 1.16610]|uniref:Cytokinin riboside 5'-monophosphate phosphoribohydrolase n=1 Tax=Paenibacillus anseongense TaxID=2682845 RepID=A0ABW9U4B6_9BACL|nr:MULTISPECIES: TIGR00730 family Rossman fold protein [Paenibacillus]MBA2938970.1 TIGR00730 family Rossman fold protein [Paenibacillus sp. CGMCC 1.16610]MVQ34932.1 TIGR00730 family Rossman fold protein [Paenibacillus anseongense]